MKRKITFIFNALLVMVFVFAFALPASAGTTYKLGMSLAITGPTSDAGNPQAKGAEDWFKFVNETDYLGDGDTIDCPIRDDQYKNDITKRFFEEFLDDGILIFLSYATGANLALRRDIEEVQIPTIPASYHEGLIVGANYTFMPVATYSENTIGLAEYVTKNHKGGDTPKVAFFIHPSAFGRAPLEDTQKAIELGMNIDIVEVVEHGTDLDVAQTQH